MYPKYPPSTQTLWPCRLLDDSHSTFRASRNGWVFATLGAVPAGRRARRETKALDMVLWLTGRMVFSAAKMGTCLGRRRKAETKKPGASKVKERKKRSRRRCRAMMGFWKKPHVATEGFTDRTAARVCSSRV